MRFSSSVFYWATIITTILFIVVNICFAADNKGAPLPPLPSFGCRPYEILPNEKTPTDVNKLRPHDIKAVIAFGDSMTAAFGAKAQKFLSEEPFVPREDRYTSFSGGAGSMQYTIPNMIGVYNRDVQGGAIGAVLPLDDLEEGGQHHEPFFKNLIRLNSALSGGRVQDVPDMINYVVKELKTTYNSTIDFNNDWKLATLLIGANNLCGACRNDTGDDPDSYETALNAVITQMYQQIPRLRLNLLPMFNIGQVRQWALSDTYCKRMWETIAESECGCVTGRNVTPQDIDILAQTAAAYRDRSAKVAQQWANMKLSNFTVAYQPFTGDVKITNGALTSNFDCFHPSWITHAWLGVGLWNSMMLPPNQKPTNATYYLLNGVDIICPEKDTYLQ